MHLGCMSYYLRPENKAITTLIQTILAINTSKKIFVIRLLISSLFSDVAVKLLSLSENFPATTPISDVSVVVSLK